MCSRSYSKQWVMFLVVLVLVSYSLLAFPGRKAPIAAEEQKAPVVLTSQGPSQAVQEAVQEKAPQEEQKDPVSPEMPSEKASEIDSEETSRQLKELSQTLSDKTIVTGRSLEELRSTINRIKSDTELMIADNQEMESKYIEALEANARQADDLAAIKESLKREQSMKALAKVGAVIGFKNGSPTWGISGAVGMRSGAGFLVEAGAQYMLGTFTAPPTLAFELDNLAITCSVGWEW